MAGDEWLVMKDDWHEQCLPSTAFLRRIPRGLSPRDRVVLDYLLLTADMIDLHWQSLNQAILAIGRDIEAVSPAVRASIFASSWGIIEQVHSARYISRLIAPKTERGPVTKSFLATSFPASQIRNKLHHTYEHLPNTLQAKQRFPVLGVVTWFYWGDAPTLPIYAIAISGGASAATGNTLFSNPLDEPLRTPVDRVVLQLGGINIRLLDLIRSFRGWLRAQDEDIKQSLTKQLQKHADEHGTEAQVLIEDVEPPFDIIFEMRPDISVPPLTDCD